MCLEGVGMNPGARDGTIPAELENTCAEEPIHLLGVVQSYGFMMVVDIASRCIVQVSAGIVKHWPGLPDAGALLSKPLSEWAAPADASAAPGSAPDPALDLALDLDALPTS